MDPNLKQGHFAKKQLFSKSGIIRWSHRRRFEVAVAKSSAFAGLRVLDFGCGDGTYGFQSDGAERTSEACP